MRTPTARLCLALVAALPLAACGAEGQAHVENAAAAAVPSASVSPDPCSLLTRTEAEAVLGPLVAEPFRTREGTRTPDPAGPSCAYATGGDRALLLTPEWRYGKLTLDAERLVGGMIRRVADLPGAAADTLEGGWDEAVVSVSGLTLRKGARSLSIGYEGSSADLAGAMRIAAPALVRLAAAPEPPRPPDADDGCPLPSELVGGIVGMRVRVKPAAVQMLDACAYELEDDPMVQVELSIRPAQLEKMVFDGLHSRAKLVVDSAETIPVGEVGWAYGSSHSSEAAARADGNVYQALIVFSFGADGPDLRDAMVKLVASMMTRRDGA